jgi:ABC-type polysaccharide/polyol phosphate export permease
MSGPAAVAAPAAPAYEAPASCIPDARFYDSARRRRPLLDEARNIHSYRGLVGLLVHRNLIVGYKRSILGVWWTLLDPLLTMVVMWGVFSTVFRVSTGGVPYVVYLLSGIIVFRFFEQGVLAVGASLMQSAPVLSRIYVPAETFSLAAAAAAAVTFLLSLGPLLVIQLAHGIGIPWTLALLPLPALALLALVMGAGLALASAAVRYYDFYDFAAVGLRLLGFLTPTFYPVDALSAKARLIVELNPLYSYLLVFRSLIYQGALAPWWAWLTVGGTSAAALVAGVWLFSRSWPRTVAML